MAQIHASKNTYCSYVSPEDAQYDIIVPNLKKINIRTIAEAKKARASVSHRKRGNRPRTQA